MGPCPMTERKTGNAEVCLLYTSPSLGLGQVGPPVPGPSFQGSLPVGSPSLKLFTSPGSACDQLDGAGRSLHRDFSAGTATCWDFPLHRPLHITPRGSEDPSSSGLCLSVAGQVPGSRRPPRLAGARALPRQSAGPGYPHGAETAFWATQVDDVDGHSAKFNSRAASRGEGALGEGQSYPGSLFWNVLFLKLCGVVDRRG